MRAARTLSKAERIIAFCLALIWIAGGSAALYIAIVQSRWVVGIVAFAALAYGIAWVRVARLARLLSWTEFLAPWRSGS
jgi:hypothetical protein